MVKPHNERPLKEKISISIDGDVLLKLRGMADYDARNLSQYINLVLKHHVQQFYDKEIHVPYNSDGNK